MDRDSRAKEEEGKKRKRKDERDGEKSDGLEDGEIKG